MCRRLTAMRAATAAASVDLCSSSASADSSADSIMLRGGTCYDSTLGGSDGATERVRRCADDQRQHDWLRPSCVPPAAAAPAAVPTASCPESMCATTALSAAVTMRLRMRRCADGCRRREQLRLPRAPTFAAAAAPTAPTASCLRVMAMWWCAWVDVPTVLPRASTFAAAAPAPPAWPQRRA